MFRIFSSDLPLVVNMARKQLLLFLTVFAFVSFGTAKQCYVCSSFTEKNCTDPFNQKPAFEETCDIPNWVCAKQIVRPLTAGRENFFRGCVAPDYCITVKKQSSFCEECAVDLCNSSSVLAVSLMLPFILMIWMFL